VSEITWPPPVGAATPGLGLGGELRERRHMPGAFE
jgi:hypothetical protein